MKQIYEPLENLSIKKSNSLVSAKYKSSLIENQIMAVALTRIEVNAQNADSPIEAKLYPGELKRLIGDPTNIYRTLKKLSTIMTGHTMFIEDGNGNFKAFAVVTNAEYIGGVFTLTFNKNLRGHILGLEKNYTTFELSVLVGFKKNSSFRIYELLKSHIYKSDIFIDNGRVFVEYNINELRFMIGLANGDDPSVKNAMASMGNKVDWDVLYSKLDKKDRKYETWYDFQRYVIKPAQVELEEKSNIRFEYEGVRQGKKIGKILFHVYPNTPKNPDVIDERKQLIESNAIQYRQMELPLDIMPDLYEQYVGHNNLSKEDIDLLIQKAAGDTEAIHRAISMADAQPEIHNYMGWLVKCIENGYNSVGTIYGDSTSYERAEELRQNVERDRRILAFKIWERYKSQEEFSLFLEEVVGPLDLEQLELAYAPEELTQMYSDWHRQYSTRN